LKGAGSQRHAVAAFPPGTIPVTNFTDGWVFEKKIFGCFRLDELRFVVLVVVPLKTSSAL
jgi:hypothetical protein